MPPTIHAAKNKRSLGILAAIPAEDLKMPLPIVEPMSTVTALNSPSFRGSSIQKSPRAYSPLLRGGVAAPFKQTVCYLTQGAAGEVRTLLQQWFDLILRLRAVALALRARQRRI